MCICYIAIAEKPHVLQNHALQSNRTYGENRIETLLEKRNKLYIHPQKLPEIYGGKKEPINVNLTWMWDHQLKTSGCLFIQL